MTPMLSDAPEDLEVRDVTADAARPGTADAAPPAPDAFPGAAAEGAAPVSASAPARAGSARHGWHVLAILSALMGFASISTDLYPYSCGCTSMSRRPQWQA
jgi:hypothetical protein